MSTPLEAAKDTLAGAVSAVAQTAVGHPFNTVKIRLQVAGGGARSGFAGPVACAAALLRAEGPRALYAGMGSMLVGQQLTNITLFGSYQLCRRLLADDYAYVGAAPRPQRQQLSWAIPVAGCAAGLTNSFILCPVELVAVRLQIQSLAGAGGSAASTLVTHYSGPLDCLRQMVAADGVAALYNGLRPTFAREAVGVTCWFSAYEVARAAFIRSNGEAPAGWQIAVCGGCGGLGFWGTAFPLDTVKSRLQTQNARHPNAYRGVVDALRRIVREEGWLTLYNGYSTALVRAACTGGSVFFAYEYARALLG